MKKLLAILLVICMMMSMLAACGSSETASTEAPAAAPAEEAAPAAPAEEPAAQEPVTLTILWGQSTTDAGVEDMIDEYMAANYPHITIEWECVDWGNDFQPKMQQYICSFHLRSNFMILQNGWFFYWNQPFL